MEVRFDWPVIYSSVLESGGAPEKAAHGVARLIRRDVVQSDLRPGQHLGTAPDLCRRYGVGRETLLEASRLLSSWEIATMRRGPGGGLTVLPSPRWNAVKAIAAHLRDWHLTEQQRGEALNVLSLLQDYHEASRAGRGEDFNRGIQAQLMQDRLPVGRACPSEPAGWNRTLRPFVDAVHLLNEHVSIPPLVQPGAERPLAAMVADHLRAEIERRRPSSDVYLGVEGDLIERMGVSRQVMRQAIRLLEDRGQVQCRRGRGHGISAVTGHPAIIVEQLSEHFELIQLVEGEYRPMLHFMSRLLRLLAASKVSRTGFRAMSEAVTNASWNDPASHMVAVAREWSIVANPVFSLFIQTLCAYRCRRAETLGRRVLVGDIDVPKITSQIAQHLEALEAGRLADADRLSMAMDQTVTATLGSF